MFKCRGNCREALEGLINARNGYLVGTKFSTSSLFTSGCHTLNCTDFFQSVFAVIGFPPVLVV